MMLAMLACATALAGSAGATAGASNVAALDWLAGAWIQEKDGVTVREVWLSPKDGVMSGVGQTNRPGRKPFVEYVKISAEPAGVTFTATLSGQPPTAFLLQPGRPGEAVFENKAHDFPQRVIYRRCGEDLCAAIEGEVKGKLQRQTWRYTRLR